MEVIHSTAPLYAMLVSLGAVFAIYFSGKTPNLREFWTIAAAFIKFGIVLYMVPAILQGKEIELTLIEAYPGLDIMFRVDSLGLFFALMASSLWIITSFYSISYVRAMKEHAQTRYFMCFAGSLSATMGAAFAGNLFTMYIFYEMLTLFTYPLILHEETSEAFRGAKIYLTYLLGTSIAFLLPAVLITYFVTGTTDFTAGGLFVEAMSGGTSAGLLGFTFFLFIAGTAKAGIMPFHSWLPNAMVAPTPVSSLLHAVAVVKMGVFVVLRIVLFVFGVDLLKDIGAGTVLAYFASITIIVSSIIAMRQDNIKARLAYSTVSQLSYIVVGVSLLSTSAVKGSIMHMMVHGFSKITLFFWAGAVYVALGKKYISQINGIAKKMPISMAIFTIGALSLIGIPPMAGFISKFYLMKGAVEADMLPIAFVYAGSSFLNACYFLPIIYIAYFKPLSEDLKPGYKEAPVMMLVSMMITSFMVFVLFFFPKILTSFADIVAAGMGGY
ncbi:monovalent cation/H+ antiporter subunit D family protein [Limisalsivibrio acetivorans]|uniref:monovalent cation/H+ antiporter subunit D family protein n=1 Tax=Limisalsivibrio acetivorans TaxID=1304888 RepID=UPI0003B3E98A|nr:monovalent cation/H+ antiporter subunit D family protein [Limisalsivibrio acetivorans]